MCDDDQIVSPWFSLPVQVKVIKEDHYYTISDILPGVEYLIQLRASEEYDGQWSDWSAPVNASSWIGNCVKRFLQINAISSHKHPMNTSEIHVRREVM